MKEDFIVKIRSFTCHYNGVYWGVFTVHKNIELFIGEDSVDNINVSDGEGNYLIDNEGVDWHF